ncbi:hypothetical protein C8F04DRAFT_1253843 [Mycena alexandri]|uniref:Uncharacterized protein n=1 Tax=Mycena alexandri TaxID=1745969 RepID=A0AAD6X8G7_9AGAR|nr:hypothetical protein C8F04DRAFT_1253843 [Mycena alexandri]
MFNFIFAVAKGTEETGINPNGARYHCACETTKPGYHGKGSVEVSPPTNEHDSPTRRLAISADKLVTQSFAGIDTVYEVLQYVAKTHSTSGYKCIT